MSKKSFFLITVQFSSLLFLFFTSSQPLPFYSLGFIVAGVMLGFWAIMVMRVSKLRVQPEVHDQSILVINGPYKWIRHPMYSSLILFTFGLFLSSVSWWRLVLLLIFIDNLRLKINYEEALLVKHFQKKYIHYQQVTSKVIPLIW